MKKLLFLYNTHAGKGLLKSRLAAVPGRAGGGRVGRDHPPHSGGWGRHGGGRRPGRGV